MRRCMAQMLLCYFYAICYYCALYDEGFPFYGSSITMETCAMALLTEITVMKMQRVIFPNTEAGQTRVLHSPRYPIQIFFRLFQSKR